MAGKSRQSKVKSPGSDFFPYASKFDKRLLETWWFLPAFLPYVLSKLLLLPIYLTEKDWFPFWSREDLIYLYVPAVLLAALIPYNSWTPSIRTTFDILGRRLKSSRSGSQTNTEYRKLLNRLKAVLESPWRFILVLILSAFTLIVLGLMIAGPGDIAYTLIPSDRSENLAALKFAYLTMFYVVSPLAWIYLISTGTWVIVTAGRYLQLVPMEFEILVEPRHPDKLGGLQFVGDFCLGLSYPILIGAVLISLLKITQPLSDALDKGIGWGLILFALPLAYLAFFAPLWGISKEMALRKHEFYEEGLQKINRIKRKIEKELGEEKPSKETQALIDALKKVSEWYGIDYPVLPLDRNILLKFLTPQVISVITLFFGLNDALQPYLDIFGD